MTPDGTTIIFAEDDLDEGDVSLEAEEEAEDATVKSSGDSVEAKDCDSCGDTQESPPASTNATPETTAVDAE